MLESEIIQEVGLDSFSGSIFGDKGQLYVMQRVKIKNRKAIYYRVRCQECSLDSELYGDGLFYSSKSNLNSGHIPCGCSGQVNRTGEQWKILLTRKLKDSPYRFLDFVEDFKGINTKCIMECPAHGEWNTGTLANIYNKDSLCPSCKYEINAWNRKKTDIEATQMFF